MVQKLSDVSASAVAEVSPGERRGFHAAADALIIQMPSVRYGASSLKAWCPNALGQ